MSNSTVEKTKENTQNTKEKWKIRVLPRVAIVRGCYTMENGPNAKNWEKMGKTWTIRPDRKRGKHGRKIPNTSKIGPNFYLFGIFWPCFSPVFDRGELSMFFPSFPPFLVFGPFSLVWQPRTNCNPGGGSRNCLRARMRGRGLATAAPKIQQKLSPGIVFSDS